jgi:hypothetical protein
LFGFLKIKHLPQNSYFLEGFEPVPQVFYFFFTISLSSSFPLSLLQVPCRENNIYKSLEKNGTNSIRLSLPSQNKKIQKKKS